MRRSTHPASNQKERAERDRRIARMVAESRQHPSGSPLQKEVFEQHQQEIFEGKTVDEVIVGKYDLEPTFGVNQTPRELIDSGSVTVDDHGPDAIALQESYDNRYKGPEK